MHQNLTLQASLVVAVETMVGSNLNNPLISHQYNNG
jgi:hypothetical protein